MAANLQTVVDITQTFVSCTECWKNPKTFRKDGASALLAPWCPPRGWAGTERPGPRDVMVVAFNPGAPMPDERPMWSKAEFRAGACSPEQALLLLERCTANYVRPEEQDRRDSVFHRKSVGLVRAALWLFGLRDIEDASWTDRCWFTDVFKCSTRDERGPRIPSAAMSACRRHLTTELEYFQPKVVLTLGGRAAAATGELERVPVVRFRFPSGGLAALTSESLTDKFDAIAAAAGVRLTEVARREFAGYREALRARLFP